MLLLLSSSPSNNSQTIHDAGRDKARNFNDPLWPFAVYNDKFWIEIFLGFWISANAMWILVSLRLWVWASCRRSTASAVHYQINGVRAPITLLGQMCNVYVRSTTPLRARALDDAPASPAGGFTNAAVPEQRSALETLEGHARRHSEPTADSDAQTLIADREGAEGEVEAGARPGRKSSCSNDCLDLLGCKCSCECICCSLCQGFCSAPRGAPLTRILTQIVRVYKAPWRLRFKAPWRRQRRECCNGILCAGSSTRIARGFFCPPLAFFNFLPVVGSMYCWPRWHVLSADDFDKLKEFNVVRPTLLFSSLAIGSLCCIVPGPFALLHGQWNLRVEAGINDALRGVYVSWQKDVESDLYEQKTQMVCLFCFYRLRHRKRTRMFFGSTYQDSST